MATIRAQETGHFRSGFIPPFPPRSAQDFSMVEQLAEPTLSIFEKGLDYGREGGERDESGERAELKSKGVAHR